MKRHTLLIPILVLIGTVVALIVPGAPGFAASPAGIASAASAGRQTRFLAPDATATFFIAHPGGVEATAGNPILVSGGDTVTFEVRMRDAGSGNKAAWQADLLLDACKFETTPVSVSFVGNIFQGFGSVFSTGPTVELDKYTGEVNVLHISFTQTSIDQDGPWPTTSQGLLATVTVKTKALPSCPKPGTPTTNTTIAFRPSPGSFVAEPAPGVGQVAPKYTMTLNTGYLTYTTTAVTLTQMEATSTAIGWPLLAAVLVALLAGVGALAWRSAQRARQ